MSHDLQPTIRCAVKIFLIFDCCFFEQLESEFATDLAISRTTSIQTTTCDQSHVIGYATTKKQEFAICDQSHAVGRKSHDR